MSAKASSAGTSVLVLDADVVAAFAGGLRGDFILPGDAVYDDARHVWNAMIDRQPAMIVRCAGVADVVAAVGFARAHGLPIAIRGGGHNVAGSGCCDDGLVVDLSRMKGIRVDPDARTVRAEGGVTWGELDHETLAFGLACTGGTVSTTGIAGLTLGGGFGWLMRSRGLASDNLVAADVVTADGRFLRASRDENLDLFWGLRGGGGNFGVVTSLEYRLQPIGEALLAGVVFHNVDDAAEPFRVFREEAFSAPDAVGAGAVLVTSAAGDRVAGLILVHDGPIGAGEHALRPFREAGSPIVDAVGPTPYRVVQTMFDAAFPPGRRNYWKSGFLSSLDDQAIAILVDRFRRSPNESAGVIVEVLGGAVSRVDPAETAFSHRAGLFSILIFTGWDDPADDETNIAWARGLWADLQPFAARGVYVNYLGNAAAEEGDRARSAYGASWERLAALKRAYDPDNLFRINQNVAPA